MRTERHIVKYNNPYYRLLDEYCFMSKNLYNFANYHIRQEFIKNKKVVPYGKLDKLMKIENEGFDYRNMPSSQASQQCLKILSDMWKSFFSANKDYKKNPNKYLGRPKLPNYKKKNGRNLLVFTNQVVKIKDGYLAFPKKMKGFKIKTKLEKFQQVRILPRYKHFIVEVVYRVDKVEPKKDNGLYIGIDLGINNFATVGSNLPSFKPIIINGKSIKSFNKYYNKLSSRYKEISKRMNNLDYTNRLNRLTIKRNNKVSDYIHKASKSIIDYALSYGINTIIIGNNKNWKQKSKMSKKVNQSFVGIPHKQFIDKIVYKAESVGLNVIITEESYTSGTSFLDEEEPIKKFYNKSRRIFRGLFISNNGIKINSDLNGAYQIIKKVVPKVFDNGIEGVGLHPIKVDII